MFPWVSLIFLKVDCFSRFSRVCLNLAYVLPMVNLLFKILAGVLQGDTLGPLIFIIALDYVLHKPRERRYPAEKITDTDFANDLALFADNTSRAGNCYMLLSNLMAAIA